MRAAILGVSAIIVALVALMSALVVVAPPPTRPPGPFPINTTVRALSTTPDRFDRQIVRIHGLVNLEFEDFSVHDPAWSDEPPGDPEHGVPRIQVDYAELGRFDAGPLLRDGMFLAFEARMRERSERRLMTGATMVGRFEGGSDNCRFVLSQVESVDVDYAATLSYRYYWRFLSVPRNCRSTVEGDRLPGTEAIRSWQLGVNAGGDGWRLDARCVAEDYLRQLTFRPSGDITSVGPGVSRPAVDGTVAQPLWRPASALVELPGAAYEKRFEWTAPDRSLHVFVIVARPYWLLPVADAAERVIWVPVDAGISCSPPSNPALAPHVGR
jgi:hypothetical protein